MATLAYEVVDVFTDQPFTGNPLAVVFGADGLGTSALQAIAGEFNLAETVFLLPPQAAEATYRVRIFTPNVELPFAGHPSVGAAVTALRRGMVGAGQLVQECGAGLLALAVDGDRATLTGGSPTVGPQLHPGPLLAAAGLGGADFAGPAPRRAGCGLEFDYLPVAPEAVARAALDPVAVREHGISELVVFAWDAASQVARARVFVPGVGVPEDPATGSAALGLGVWLVTSGLLPADGESGYEVRQGAEIGRPSRLECTVTAVAGVAVSATVTGQVVPIARGEITVPPAA